MSEQRGAGGEFPGPLAHFRIEADGRVVQQVVPGWKHRGHFSPDEVVAVQTMARYLPPSMRGHPIILHHDWARPNRTKPAPPRTVRGVIASALRRMAQRLEPLEHP